MKKFLVGLLSVFMIAGASVFAACGKGRPSLNIYYAGKEVTENLEIELNPSDPEAGYISITTEMVGAGSGVDINARSSSESQVLPVKEYTSKNKAYFKIIGLSETENPALITFLGTPGNVEKSVYVNVYSVASDIQLNDDHSKSNFLVAGATYHLQQSVLTTTIGSGNESATFNMSENQLFKFYNSQNEESPNSRRNLSWQILGEGGYVEIGSDGFTVAADATTQKFKVTNIMNDKTLEFSLPVLPQINQGIDLEWNYTNTSGEGAFEPHEIEIDGKLTENAISIVPNVYTEENDPAYYAYAYVKHTGDLKITAVASKQVVKGNKKVFERLVDTESEKEYTPENLWLENNLKIENLRVTADGYTVYRIKAAKSNLNELYKLYFTVGYNNYEYASKTREITINVGEIVNEVKVSSAGFQNVSGEKHGNMITLFDNYGDSKFSVKERGLKFTTILSPSTVVKGSQEYFLALETPAGEAVVPAGQTPIFAYSKKVNESIFVPITLTYDEDQGLWISSSISARDELYLISNDQLTKPSINGFKISFVSVDNTKAFTTFNATLKKSASVTELGAIRELVDVVLSESGKIISATAQDEISPIYIDSSALNQKYTKYFRLKGQSSIAGLLLPENNEYVEFSNLVERGSVEEDGSVYVDFSIDVKLKNAAYGITKEVSYAIRHENSAQKAGLRISIILPLTGVDVYPDKGNDFANSIVYEVFENDNRNIKELMLKNSTITPLLYILKEVNGNSQSATVSISYFDFVQTETFGIDNFKALSKDDIIAGATATSRVISFQNEVEKITNGVKGNIKSHSEGFTYLVLKFSGVDLDGTLKELETKVIFIESFVAPEGLNVIPQADVEVEVYSSNSVSEEDKSLTEKLVHIYFGNPNVTYIDKDYNIEIISLNNCLESGYYEISNFDITSSGITLRISGLTTKNNVEINDILTISYFITKQNAQGQDYYVYKNDVDLAIKVKNAQRIESVEWKNADDGGLYYSVGNDEETKYILLDTSPTTAKNQSIETLFTDESGNKEDSLVEESENQFSNNTIGIDLVAKKGKTGYIYILPSDAIFGGKIKYYFHTINGSLVQPNIINGATTLLDAHTGEVVFEDLGKKYDDHVGTNFDLLVNYGYFKSNTSEGIKDVSFADILIKISVEVADGSATHPFRIYQENQFEKIEQNLHYLIMRDLTIESWETLDSFSGGIAGEKENGEITITFNSTANFANVITEKAYIKNLTFVGDVEGSGFVANENQGTIENVKVDTNGKKASVLTGSGFFVGGLVGENKNIIKNSAVLGLTINANDKVVGGLVGKNSGEISYSRVEFYNLEGGANTFTGTVGALVGIMADGKVSYTYAYDYTLTESTQALVSGNAFASSLTNGSFNYVFSVVGLSNNLTSNLTNYYSSQYADVDGVKTYYSRGDSTSNSNFMQKDAVGFDSEVNGGYPYLKQLQQPKKVSANEIQAMEIKPVKDKKDFYKSIAVSTDKAIIFFYDIKEDKEDLSADERLDLDNLNTISINELFGSYNENIILTSSNSSILKITGSSVAVLSTGDMEITISSKHDVTRDKTIEIKVISAISEMRVFVGKDEIQTSQTNTPQINLQKSKSIDVVVQQKHSELFLGDIANKYHLQENNFTLCATAEKVNAEAEGDVAVIKESFNISANIQTTDTTVNTKIGIAPKLFGEDAGDYQTAIENTFKKFFIIAPQDGVISFEISGDQISLTPSTRAIVKARITTTASEDLVSPEIVYNGKLMAKTATGNEFTYYDNMGNAIITASVEEDFTDTTSPYEYQFSITFAVHKDYRDKIAKDLEFTSYLKSDSQCVSEEFKIVITPQEFTNIDVSNVKIKNTTIQREREGSNYFEQYEVGDVTATLAPGNSSVVKVVVNPAYAYYDYAEVYYSGVSIANAINIEAVEPINDDFRSLTQERGKAEIFSTNFRYTPFKDKGHLYFKLWVNTTVEQNSTIKLTIAFYKDGEKTPVDYVNYYLEISYLQEPTVTVNGEDIAYVAKGTSTQVVVQVLENQTLDSLSISGTDGAEIYGVSLSNPSEPVVDAVKGTKTFTATLSVRVDAKTTDENKLTLQASVSRILNGVKEIKVSTATVVIVDFTIEEIKVQGANNSQLTVWQNVSKEFNLEYDLAADDREYIITNETQDVVNKLKDNKQFFTQNHYYPEADKEGNPIVDGAKYYINWVENQDGSFTKIDLLDRIFVENGANDIPWRNAQDLPFTFTEVDGIYQIKGTKSNVPSVRMVVRTYIYAGGVQRFIETPITINVEAYSNPDLPLPIKDEDDFNKLKPQSGTTPVPQDYILENDIVLENYTPFNTNGIRSLDGNGYTIYIKSFNLEESDTLNLALFNTVTQLAVSSENTATETTLKNIRVNVYNGGQLIIDISRHKEINVAGIAIENNGVITNCEVVSFFNEEIAGETIDENSMKVPCIAHSNSLGFNISYRNGENTDDEAIIADNSNWKSNVAGFVLRNTGSITNSRVGGDEIVLLSNETESSGDVVVRRAEKLDLGAFNIFAQGNVAGFVLNNSGHIASSFVKNLNVRNISGAEDFYTAGFVMQNSANGSIITSYVEGVKQEGATAGYYYTNTGSTLESDTGYVAGFIHENAGSIKDSYSNIKISNATEVNKAYLVSGFVYINSGTLENCYSASQVANSNWLHMNFSGVNENGSLRNSEGKYINCYFFNAASYQEEAQEANDDSTETQYNTGAMLIKNPTISASFYGFAVAEDERQYHRDGIWEIGEYGIKLIEADYIAHSHRYKVIIESAEGEAEYEGPTLTDDNNNKYTLKYGEIKVVSPVEYVINTSYGSTENPILISDAQDWQEISGLTTSSILKEYFTDNEIKGVYRLANNIDLSMITNLESTRKTFTGALYGNGYTISGISITQDNSLTQTQSSFGLFESIVEVEESAALISNLDMSISQVTAGSVTAVGGLAGMIRGASIINIDISFENDSKVEGLHYVGGLVGFAFGDNKIKNITIANPNIIADKFIEKDEAVNDKNYFATEEELRVLRGSGSSFDIPMTEKTAKYSYAGSVAGFVDNYTQASENFIYNDADETIYSVNNIRVKGNVNVKAQVAGGVFGLTGYNTDVRDAGLTINADEEADSHIISTRYFAGGVIGQSFGKISRIFAVHEEEIQDEIEDNMASYYNGSNGVERGVLDLFDSSKTDNKDSQLAIGGLIGYVGSGYLEISYSKLNVTALSADYAGGLIGMIDASAAKRYQVKSTYLYNQEGVNTNYFINEVFATGDIRAKVMAGGLIGAIYNDSLVRLLSVNALNYISTYNYETESEQNLNQGQYEISSNYKINSFVGQLLYNDEDKIKSEEITTVLNSTTGAFERFKLSSGENSVLSNYIYFERAQESLGGDNGGSVTTENQSKESVARYIYYSFKKQNVYLKRFGEKMLSINNTYDIEKEKIVSQALNIYSISSPNIFDDSTVGRTYTQTGFINSGIWSFENWEHPIDDLFPSIKLKDLVDVVYLDQYNAGETLSLAYTNKNTIIIVRGLKTEGADSSLPENLGHIYIYKYEGKYYAGPEGCYENTTYQFNPLSEFSGRIIGGRYTAYVNGRVEEVKLISNTNFIASTGPGFTISNQTVEYDASIIKGQARAADSDVIDIDKGLFVNSDITESSITNLTLVIKSKTIATAQGTDANNIGLVAPKIQNTSIDGITIKSMLNNSRASILTTTGAAVADERNIGLIAGELKQTSKEKPMLVKGLSITAVDNKGAYVESTVLTAADTLFTPTAANPTLNIGGYFGKVTNQDNGEYASANIQILYTEVAGFKEESKVIVSGDNVDTINVGGYAGYIDGVDGLTEPRSTVSTVDANVAFDLTESRNINAGGLIGNLKGSGSTLTLGGKQGQVVIGETVLKATNLNIGGLVGLQQKSPLIIENFDSVEFIKTTATGQTNNIGGLVGKTENSLTVYGGDNGTKIKGEIISSDQKTDQTKQEKTSQVGSVLGLVEPNSSAEVKLNGSILSDLNAQLTSSTNNIFGGMIGQISASSNEDTNITIGDGKNLLRYNGSVIQQKDIIFGGMVGQFSPTNEKHSLTVQNTSFGGQLKVQESATIKAGGSIGSIDNKNVSTSSVTLKDSYNYGDVFVEECDTSYYTFGGLIGMVGEANYTITNNYSAVSNYNSYYQTASCTTAHALFGDGVPTNKDNKAVDTKSNFYSHAVCLLADENGTDLGYRSAYTSDRMGHNRSSIMRSSNEGEIEEADIVSIIGKAVVKANIDDNEGTTIDNYPGHKLNPKIFYGDDFDNDKNDKKLGSMVVSQEDEIEGVYNGITYYTLNKDIEVKNESYKLNSAAFIGDSFEIKFINDGSVNTLFTGNDDFSVITSLIEEIDLYKENAVKNYTDGNIVTYAGLASNFGKKTQIYAVNVYGLMDVESSENVVQLSAFAYDIAGKIFDSSTDVDIINRGDPSVENLNSTNSAFATVKEKALIENCYSMGSIQTFTDSLIYTFASKDAKILNSYSATKIDARDYIGGDLNYTGTIEHNSEGVKYCKDGLDIGYGDSEFKTDKDLLSNSVVDANFNYGYPTLKYQYLKTSSYSIQGHPILSCKDVSGHNHSSEANTIYDCYVVNYSYTRVKNGNNPSEEEKSTAFYMIPNAGVLNNIRYVSVDAYNSLTGNFALKYDIDLSKSSETMSTSIPNLNGKFDGRGKTISGLKNSLFTSIVGYEDFGESSTYVRNLRLADAKIETYTTTDYENHTNDGLLADFVDSAVISNITLEGTASIKVGSHNHTATFGGLVGIARGAKIDTVTNLLKIDADNSSANNGFDIAGIVGNVGFGTEIRYCSNYGPILAWTDSKETTMGGIAGFTEGDSKVYNSYNAASLLNNFRTTTGDAVTTSSEGIRTGGIVGKVTGSGTIDGCYNSGIIKSGNSSSETMSYAGGIVSDYYGQDGDTYIISNNYNEGAVEAIGKPVEYKMEWAGGAFYNEGGVDLRITQTADTNVAVYAIGPNATKDNGNIAKVQTDSQGRSSIIANGNAAGKDSLIANYFFAPQDTGGLWMKGEEYGEYINKRFNYYSLNYDIGKVTLIQIKFNYIRKSIQIPYDVKAASTNFLGLPTAIDYEIDNDLTMDFYQRQERSLGFYSLEDVVNSKDFKINKDNEDYYKRDIAELGFGAKLFDFEKIKNNNYTIYTFKEATSFSDTKYYDKVEINIPEVMTMALNTKEDGNQKDQIITQYLSSRKLQDSFEIWNSGVHKNEDKDERNIVKQTRSQKTDNIGADTLKVAGEVFYLASNNSDSIFESDTKSIQQEFTFDIGRTDIAFEIESVVDSLNTAETTDDLPLIYKIDEAPTIDKDGKVTTILTFYTLKDSISPKVSLSLKQKRAGSYDISNWKFYNADGNIGIISDELRAISGTIAREEGQLKKGDNIYGSLIKGQSKDGKKTIYLSLENEEIVYVQNATLNDNVVNTLDLDAIHGETFTFTTTTGQETLSFTTGGEQSINLSSKIGTINQTSRLYTSTTIASGVVALGQGFSINDFTGDGGDLIILDEEDNAIAGKTAGVWYGTENVEIVGLDTDEESDDKVTITMPEGIASPAKVIKAIDEIDGIGYDLNNENSKQLSYTINQQNYTVTLGYKIDTTTQGITLTAGGNGNRYKVYVDASTVNENTSGWKVYKDETSSQLVKVPFSTGYSFVTTDYTISENIDAVYDLLIDETYLADKASPDKKSGNKEVVLTEESSLVLKVYPTHKIMDNEDSENYQIIVQSGEDYHCIANDNGTVTQKQFILGNTYLVCLTNSEGEIIYATKQFTNGNLGVQVKLNEDGTPLLNEVGAPELDENELIASSIKISTKDQYIYLDDTDARVLESWNGIVEAKSASEESSRNVPIQTLETEEEESGDDEYIIEGEIYNPTLNKEDMLFDWNFSSTIITKSSTTEATLPTVDNVNITLGGLIPNSGFENIEYTIASTKDFFSFTYSGNSATLYPKSSLKPIKDIDQIDYSIEIDALKVCSLESLTPESNNDLASYNIVLDQDISFDDVKNIILENRKIIGNGFNLSYYGSAFVSKAIKAAIKDVNLLSEATLMFGKYGNMATSAFATNATQNDSDTTATQNDSDTTATQNDLINVSFFGSYTLNEELKDQAIISGASFKKFQNVNSFMSIYAKLCAADIKLLATSAETTTGDSETAISQLEYKGVIELASGRDGYLTSYGNNTYYFDNVDQMNQQDMVFNIYDDNVLGKYYYIKSTERCSLVNKKDYILNDFAVIEGENGKPGSAANIAPSEFPNTEELNEDSMSIDEEKSSANNDSIHYNVSLGENGSAMTVDNDGKYAVSYTNGKKSRDPFLLKDIKYCEKVTVSSGFLWWGHDYNSVHVENVIGNQAVYDPGKEDILGSYGYNLSHMGVSVTSVEFPETESGRFNLKYPAKYQWSNGGDYNDFQAGNKIEGSHISIYIGETYNPDGDHNVGVIQTFFDNLKINMGTMTEDNGIKTLDSIFYKGIVENCELIERQQD